MLFRRVAYYSLLSTYLADAYASKAESMMHLTLWSWCLQTLYFELPLPQGKDNAEERVSSRLIQILHGPAFSGAHALFAMYLWTMFINPRMEIDLAPPGRPEWVVLARAVWFHAAPVVFQWMDLIKVGPILRREIYAKIPLKPKFQRWLWYFWMAVGGYFAMGLTWEQCNGDAAGTYNVTKVSPETFVAVSKAIGVVSCLGSFFFGLRPAVLGTTGDDAGAKAKKN